VRPGFLENLKIFYPPKFSQKRQVVMAPPKIIDLVAVDFLQFLAYINSLIETLWIRDDSKTPITGTKLHDTVALKEFLGGSEETGPLETTVG
jgi:hypothetical protein